MQHFGNEAFTILGYIRVLRVGIIAIFNFCVGRFYVIRLEGRSPNGKCIGDNTETPNVNLEGVAVDV